MPILLPVCHIFDLTNRDYNYAPNAFFLFYENQEKEKLIFLRVIKVKISRMVIEELLFCRPRFDRIIKRPSYQRYAFFFAGVCL